MSSENEAGIPSVANQQTESNRPTAPIDRANDPYRLPELKPVNFTPLKFDNSGMPERFQKDFGKDN